MEVTELEIVERTIMLEIDDIEAKLATLEKLKLEKITKLGPIRTALRTAKTDLEKSKAVSPVESKDEMPGYDPRKAVRKAERTLKKLRTVEEKKRRLAERRAELLSRVGEKKVEDANLSLDDWETVCDIKPLTRDCTANERILWEIKCFIRAERHRLRDLKKAKKTEKSHVV